MSSRFACGFGLSALLLALASMGGCGGDEADGLDGPSTGGSGGSTADAGQDAVDDAPADVSVDVPGDVSADTVQEATEDGAPDGPGPCLAPSDPTKRALCIFPQPESLQLEADPALDGNGILFVQVFDTPDVELADGGEIEPVATAILPDQPPGTNPPLEMNIYDPVSDLRFDDLPATVYVRVLFFDNLAALGASEPQPGIWIGGADWTKGLFVETELLKVDLPAGQGTSVAVPLSALRRLRLTMTLAGGTNPIGDGQGPAGFLLLSSQQVGDGDGGDLPAYGLGLLPCGDIHAPGGLTIDGILVGPGPYYAFAFVDDFGKGLDNGPAPGTIVDLDVSSAPPMLPAAAEVVVPSGAYSVTDSVQLNFVMPFPGVADPDVTSCTSIADAGAD